MTKIGIVIGSTREGRVSEQVAQFVFDRANKLGLDDVRKMMRTKDELYQSLGLDNPALTNDDLLKAISENSALLERPIVVKGEKAKIGRPPESVLAIL